MRRRVVVTGLGAVTPIGHGAACLWRGVWAGRSAVRRITRFDPSPFRSQIAAQIEDFDPLDFMDARSARRLDRFAQFGVACARLAVADAGLDLSRNDRRQIGVSIGSALGGVAHGEEQHEAYLRHGIRSIAPTLAVAIYGGASGANIAIDLDLRGPNLTNANSCASGAVAIGEAYRLIQREEVDVMLAGGVEAPLAPLTYGAFAIIKAMSTRNEAPETACRPFDAERDGFVMGEGAALLVLEERAAAFRRGARVYAEVVGFGHTNDAYHMTAPRPDGSEANRAIQLALGDAGIGPGEVDYVNAHATSTPLGDAAEGCALRLALGPHGANVPVSGTKGLYGHALGASGAIEAGISALALHHGRLPGTANLVRTEERCPINVLPPEGMAITPGVVLSTAFGFGGTNSALLLSQP